MRHSPVSSTPPPAPPVPSHRNSRANLVLLCDPWWNPAVENQAIDRVHRMSQERAVRVYRFICTNTVEETMLELQARKQKMATEALRRGGDAGGAEEEGGSMKLKLDELALFFR